ncbi:conjugal transfer protein TraM, partial [Salmonella enterica]|nr:conjugal transfer protein TraM [Salmonella enterica]
RGVNQQGHYSWEIQYPVTLQLMGQNTNLPEQRFIFQIMIQRADVSEKPHGLEVAQLISTNA